MFVGNTGIITIVVLTASDGSTDSIVTEMLSFIAIVVLTASDGSADSLVTVVLSLIVSLLELSIATRSPGKI